MDESRFNRTSISFLVLGLIVGFIIGYVATDAEYDDYNHEDEDAVFVVEDSALESALGGGINLDIDVEPSTPTPTVEIRDIKVSVSDQQAGDVVVVSSVNTPTKAWVAVREDRNGELWSILGARRVEPGVHSDVNVPLLRNTMAETLYHVVVYEEDGDDIFDHKADTLVSKDGIFYTESFTTTQ